MPKHVMRVTLAGMTATAMDRLLGLLEAQPGAGVALGNWRWTVRQQLSALRDQLMVEAQSQDNEWLAARRGVVVRERNHLLLRMSEIGSLVLENPDVDDLRNQLRRLLADVHRHLQRVSDLAYDDVEIELGGSE